MRLQHLTENHRKKIASLERKKFRTEHGLFLVEGWRAVRAALTGGAPLVEVLVTERMLGHKEVHELLQRAVIPVFHMEEKAGREMSTVDNDQGILAVAKSRLMSPADLLGETSILALDGVQDPGNVGTIIRTAAWFGVGGVLAGAGTADFFNPKVVRASMGGLWDVRLARSTALEDALAQCKSEGFRLYGADLEGTPISAWTPAPRSVLVIGSEARGISREIASMVDQRILIPGKPRRRSTESLNAAVAAGIILHRWLAEIG